MPPPKSQTTSPALKRRSGQLDFSNLRPLKTSGTVGFSAFRDKDSQPTRKKKSRGSNGASAMDADSDDDDEDDESGATLSKMEDLDSKEDKSKLGPDDAKFSGELADGVNRIRVCFPPLSLPTQVSSNLCPPSITDIFFSLSSSSARTRPSRTAPPARGNPPAPAPRPRPRSPPAASRRSAAPPASSAKPWRMTATSSVAL
jgi:hypothetical protein